MREGVQVTVITCTGGERGDVLNPRLKGDPELERNLPAVRRQEMARAREILGVDHEWLGFVDSGLPEGDPPPAAAGRVLRVPPGGGGRAPPWWRRSVVCARMS